MSDRHEIDAQLAEHRQRPFPVQSEDEELSEWICELSQVDAYYVGLISQERDRETNRNVLSVSELEALQARFSSIHVTATNQDSYAQCKSYLESLSNLVRACGQKNS